MTLGELIAQDFIENYGTEEALWIVLDKLIRQGVDLTREAKGTDRMRYRDLVR